MLLLVSDIAHKLNCKEEEEEEGGRSLERASNVHERGVLAHEARRVAHDVAVDRHRVVAAAERPDQVKRQNETSPQSLETAWKRNSSLYSG